MHLESTSPRYAADEAETLRGFLDHVRLTVRRQVDGLTQEQPATALPTSPPPLGGMLTQLTYVERHWFNEVFMGRGAVGIWAEVDWDAHHDRDWHSAAADDPAQLLEWYADLVREAIDGTVDL